MSVMMRQKDWMDESARFARVVYVKGVEARLLLLLLCLWRFAIGVCTVVCCTSNTQRLALGSP